MANQIQRGDIYYADLSGVQGSEQGGVRPILVFQNDVGNKYSPCIIAFAITSQINKAKLPTHVELEADEYNLSKNSVILCEQVRTLDKKRLKSFVSYIDEDKMFEVENAIAVSFGMVSRMAV